MLTLQLQITDGQMESLADMIAERIAGKTEASTRPLTAKQAAARLGVSESTVTRLSNGQTTTEGEDAR